MTGTVSAVAGAVLELPTRGIPMRNPNCHELGNWSNKCKKRETDEKAKGLANLVVDTL